jgi:hypothetical protein
MSKSNHYILKYGDWKFGQGNASAHTLHQPPFAYPAPKEKRKYISASAWTEKFIFIFFLIRVDAVTGPHGRHQHPRERGPRLFGRYKNPSAGKTVSWG